MNREICNKCGKPVATDDEFETIPEGEGEHLCWGPWHESGECPMQAPEVIGRLRAECDDLLDMLMDAVNQGAPRYHKELDRVMDGALSTWERILPELVSRGLAKGNPKDGYELIWPACQKRCLDDCCNP